MAHCCLLFVGTFDNLQDIYDDCPDSSSESAAEMTIGADWINEFDDCRGSGEFTKFTKETKGKLHLNYEDVINGNWYACYDIRDRHNYGDFGWVNIPEKMIDLSKSGKNMSWDEIEEHNNKQICEALKELPDDTVFFFADSHW